MTMIDKALMVMKLKKPSADVSERDKDSLQQSSIRNSGI